MTRFRIVEWTVFQKNPDATYFCNHKWQTNLEEQLELLGLGLPFMLPFRFEDIFSKEQTLNSTSLKSSFFDRNQCQSRRPILGGRTL
jgi:hypothetical protein